MFPATPSSSTWHGRRVAPGGVHRSFALASWGSRRRNRRHMRGGTGLGFGAPWGASRSPRAWSRAAAGPGAMRARPGSGAGSSRARRRGRTWWPGRCSDGSILLAGSGGTSAQGSGSGRGQGPGGSGRGPDAGQGPTPGQVLRGAGQGSQEWPGPWRGGAGRVRFGGGGAAWLSHAARLGGAESWLTPRESKSSEAFILHQAVPQRLPGDQNRARVSLGAPRLRIPSVPPARPALHIPFPSLASRPAPPPQLNPPLPFPLPSHPGPPAAAGEQMPTTHLCLT